MKQLIVSYALVLTTVLLTVYGQIIIKWQVMQAGILPDDTGPKLLFVLKLLLNPWIVTALATAFLAMLTWMMAMTRLPLTQGYPLTSLSFVLILIFGHLLFGETLTLFKISGILFIMVGIALASHG